MDPYDTEKNNQKKLLKIQKLIKNWLKTKKWKIPIMTELLLLEMAHKFSNDGFNFSKAKLRIAKGEVFAIVLSHISVNISGIW